MKPAAFSYERATSLEHALQWLNEHPESKVLAGGQSLIPLMNFRLSRPQELLDINGVEQLSYVEQTATALRLGGLIRHQQLHENKTVQAAFPVLAEAAGEVGHWAIRNRGTLGGSLVHADPASELPAVMVALQATFLLTSVDGVREVPAQDFYLGFLTTDIQANEIFMGVEIPLKPEVSYGFKEFARRPGDFALAGAIVELHSDAFGAVTWFGVSGAPVREEMSFASEAEDRRAAFAEIIETMDLMDEGPYRKQLALSVAEQAYLRAAGRDTL
ncbi:MAG: hypothetical protein A2201_07735 [Alicyclobacillus sp. RIFOXYA1_FULL_53_8]|nr:MAG: hypothetical protein A2201_07735 [Alicyclobacillus sp. RIFOXYA1_FULL_53_8]